VSQATETGTDRRRHDLITAFGVGFMSTLGMMAAYAVVVKKDKITAAIRMLAS
jgi:hypothetical protein